ncbi:hypothetical protein KQX54_017315 [Cotesia glomerata]|uniref:Uncharacterized protein n=1 Tax=Cotesia glomerata TaxID=32391 RepID=A0AAV7ICT7_COTGL|nr:hypothetical protein KQX54_017315 [Cotesia glomerata]
MFYCRYALNGVKEKFQHKLNRGRGVEAREKRFQLVFCFLVQVMLSITITIIYTEYGGDEDERKPFLESGLFLSIFHPRNQSRVYRPGMKVLERKIRSIKGTSHLTPPNPWKLLYGIFNRTLDESVKEYKINENLIIL